LTCVITFVFYINIRLGTVIFSPNLRQTLWQVDQSVNCPIRELSSPQLD